MSPEQFQVRAGVANDVQKLVEIEREAASTPWSLNQFLASSLRDNEYSLVCEQIDGVIAGFCVYQRVLDEATLMNIAVHPHYQGIGLGGLLVDRLLQILLDSGVESCLLEVRCSNEVARALYRKTGFVDDGVRKDYYPTDNGREDALLMSCQLVHTA